MQTILYGINNKIEGYKEGKLFTNNPKALVNNINDDLNSQFRKELRNQLQNRFPNILADFENSVEILKKSI